MIKTYAYHKPGLKGFQDVQKLRQAFGAIHETVEHLAPPSRERSVALTNLEQAAMWAIKAVVHNDPESEVEQELKP